MSAASYYNNSATQEQTSHVAPASDQEQGPMHSGARGYGQDMHEQQQHGFPQQGYNEQSGNGIYNEQEPKIVNSNYAQGAQQMGQGAVADDRDTLTKLLDKIEKKFGGERFNNPENAEKNKALNANILKRVKQVMGMVMQRAPGMLMRMVK